MPAAAVIPAPVVHIHAVVKKFVVVFFQCCEEKRAIKVYFNSQYTKHSGADKGNCIQQLEVKIDDLLRTFRGESDCLVRIR